MPENEVASVCRRLAETAAWCRQHASLDDPVNSLRTPALRPEHWERSDTFYQNFDWGTHEDRTTPAHAIAALGDTRAVLLRQEGNYPDVLDILGGRLLIAAPGDSDVCGLSIWESAGFIDDYDIPPWDAWVYFVQEERFVPESEVAPDNRYVLHPMVWYLLCWIPKEFFALVEAGISVNPTECFFWASEYKKRGYDTPLLRQLDADRLLEIIG